MVRVFLDFAFITSGMRLAIEIDDYRTHSSETTRWKFSDSLMRQNHLILDGWKILRFSYDDFKEKPRMCQQLLQPFMGRNLAGRKKNTSAQSFLEIEVIQLANYLQQPLRPSDVIELLKFSKRQTHNLLQRLLHQQMLIPAGNGTKRIRCYNVNKEYLHTSLFANL